MISTWLIENVGLPFIKYGAMALAILGLIFGARKWGQNVERVESLQQTIKGAKERAKFVSTLGPDTNDNFLRKPSDRSGMLKFSAEISN